ncbi:hypothetical protein EOE18_15405 [Novosphingobium umbonatum]|uniref:MarR family transcriptional regulator n=1 Tax=Novosphingobium umbonatum TaxID=1908524 RepID=A0A3S2VBE9_9SPHN|nr:hypothetical protein [Novosphingobium umbonatum]RVU03507.1 hypothetical protein EOE18_15405 [Novosphingobium umbonatum]
MSAALATLAETLPERTTLRQVYALVALMHQQAMGKQLTLTQLTDDLGDDLTGAPLLGSSPERVMDKFKPATRKAIAEVAALPKEEREKAKHKLPKGWVEAVENEDDRRHKFLELTAEGREVAVGLAAIIKGSRDET